MAASMHFKARHPLRPLPPLLLSLALGCTGPAPEQDAPRTSSVSKQSPPPGLRPSWVKDLQESEVSSILDANTSWVPVTPVVTASGTVFFGSRDGNNGSALWKTDGTPEGTHLVRQFAASTRNGFLLESIAAVGDTVYFAVQDDRLGSRLFKSDGTPEGTLELPQPEGSLLERPGEVTACDGRVFFRDPQGLWTLEGTPERPVLLAPVHIYPDGGQEQPVRRVVCAEGTLFFVGTPSRYNFYSELWTSDGTPEGTVSLAPLGFVSDWSNPLLLTSGPRVFVNAYDTRQTTFWTSDGTPEGTHEIGGFNPYDRELKVHTAAGGSLYFSLPDTTTTDPDSYFAWGMGLSLRKSDSTGTGSQKVVDLPSELQALSPSGLAVGNTLLLSTPDGRLYRSDGTPEGTFLLANLGLPEAPEQREGASLPDGRLLFAAREPSGETRLWVTDGTVEGTTPIQTAQEESLRRPAHLTRMGDRVLFWADDGLHGQEPWVTDGTPGGTRLLRDLYRSNTSLPQSLTDAEGTLFFVATSEQGSGLWKSDGTAEGTTFLQALVTTDPFLRTTGFTPVGSSVFFFQTRSFAPSLWTSDGTAAGTLKLRDFRGGDVASRVALGSTFFFSAFESASGSELWKSDGTVEGTVLFKDIFPGPGSSSPVRLTRAGNGFFFAANDGLHGSELWKSDGTAEGTMLVADLAPGMASAFPTIHPSQELPGRLTAAGGTVYFAADDGVHGTEPWKSDGTAAGTVLLRDVLPGSENSGAGILPFVPVGNQGAVAFTASDGVSGQELWTSDGTPEGTRRFADVYPGPASASPLQLTVSGSRLFFVANDGEHGRELWSVKQAAFQHQP
ncbi:MAG TPA: ELWxxDGT repeat protein [Archangium sp.]|nr:ELWxxDGT repeat protein [Archangium sp.]